jgi:glutamate-5-semialdehyde dehydrogenase
MIIGIMDAIGRGARSAAPLLELAASDQKNRALRAAAAALRARRHKILAANEGDMQEALDEAASAPLLDRLRLDEKRIEAMAGALEDIAELADPIGTVLAEWTRPNGMRIQRRRVPLGVIGIIYESRPNVTADAGALCLKSGNAVILRGGSESARSNAAIHACLQEGLHVAGLPSASIQLVPTTDRAAVGYMLAEMSRYIDVIVPRGGKQLIERVQREARVPVIGHLEGLCHVFVERAADLSMAHEIVSIPSCAAPASAVPPRRCSWMPTVRRRISARW